MEENVKKDNKRVKILIGLIILIISIVILFVLKSSTKRYDFRADFNDSPNICNAISVEHKIFEYNMDEEEETFLGTGESDTTKSKIISNYKEYQNLVEDFSEIISNKDDSEKFDEIENELSKKKYSEKFFEKYNIVLVENTTYNRMLKNIKLDEVVYNYSGLQLVVSIKYETYGIVGGKSNALFFMEIRKDKMNGAINVTVNANMDSNKSININHMTYDKPIIYLYPQNNTKVTVKLGSPEKLLCSYPLYNNNGWEVNAEPDGMLTYLENGRKLYSLYYESESIVNFDIEDNGFVIKGEDTASFLEEKLEILGLNEIEAEEFIIYWLPKLEANKYNYIRFATTEEINDNMELLIEPKPDSVIRVMMIFKGLDEPIEVKEQELSSPNREGFVAVEWGGTEIK